MGEDGVWGQKIGRPTYDAGLADPAFQKFEAHLNRLQKRRRNTSDKRLFAVIGKLANPKDDKLKPHLKFLLELAGYDPHWHFGGPFQVSLLMRWNKLSKLHDRSGPRKWARSEVGNLWKMERALDTLAADPEECAIVVQDVAKYPITQKWCKRPSNQQRRCTPRMRRLHPCCPGVHLYDRHHCG